MPDRIQPRRAAGWRMPEGTIYVGRPGPFGNPFPWRGAWAVWAAVAVGFKADEAGRKAAAVAHFRQWLLAEPARGPHADDRGDDMIEFESGVGLSTAEHCRNLAASFAMIASDRIKVPKPPSLDLIKAKLRGHDLACWRPILLPDGARCPCHADVLLDLANA